MKSLEQIPGLGKDRSQYLTEDKYNEIVSCLAEFSTLTSKDKKVKYPQGHAWNKKYKLLSVANSRVLILNPEFKGRKAGAGENEEGGEGASGALDQSVVISHAGRVFEDLLKIHVAGGTANRRRCGRASKQSTAAVSHRKSQVLCRSAQYKTNGGPLAVLSRS